MFLCYITFPARLPCLSRVAVIDCGGVGYGCRVTAYTAGQLKLNQNARLYITESIREDAL